MNCPICESENSEKLLSLNAGGFDGSRLYRNLEILCCECGHVFNELTSRQYEDMFEYYRNEYSVYNVQSPNKSGDLPGSANKNATVRYGALMDSIGTFLSRDSSILDVGCAMGGFLKFLKDKGFRRLFGVDICDEYVRRARLEEGIVIEEGYAESIPFKKEFDFILADQVLEHMLSPGKLFSEARRILKPGGFLCVSVPNATEYLENHFFDFYWFLMREHVQHFDRPHLLSLGSQYGFSPKAVSYANTPMLTDEVRLPSLTVVFERGEAGIVPDHALKANMVKYIAFCNNGLSRSRAASEKLPAETAAFGASRELLYLCQNTMLSKCLFLVIDDTPSKQKQRVGGIPIRDSSVLSSLKPESSLLITAFAHRKALAKKSKELGYKGTTCQI
jgi:SAM-dependent methyltransferase